MRRTHSSALSAALMLGLGLAASATPTQAAGIDNTFGFGGKAFTPMSQPLGDRFLNAVRGPAGGTYAVGYAVLSGTDRAMAVARADRNGDLVASFGNNGVATVNMAAPPFLAPPAGTAPTGAAEVARGIVVQSDGRIVISGFAETPSIPLPADSRDTDVYAARFYPDGTLDASFGVNGATRIDLAPSSSATATAPTGDQAYGLAIQPDDRLVIDASRGTDDVARPGRTDRDLTAIRLTKDGVPDPTFKGAGQPDGISSIHATATNSSSTSVEVSENARQSVVQPDGKIVLASYSAIPATPNAGNEGNRPFIARFDNDGIPDATFGTGGYASGQPLGATPSFSEAYDVALQSTGSYVVVGYGSNAATVAATGTDAVAYRFTSAGVLDPTFGTGGVTAYNQSGGTDQARDISVLPDGRLAIVGNTVPGGAGNGANGFVMVLSANGAPDTSVTPGGGFQFELGGPSDSFMGSGHAVISVGTNSLPAAGSISAQPAEVQRGGDLAVMDGQDGLQQPDHAGGAALERFRDAPQPLLHELLAAGAESGDPAAARVGVDPEAVAAPDLHLLLLRGLDLGDEIAALACGQQARDARRRGDRVSPRRPRRRAPARGAARRMRSSRSTRTAAAPYTSSSTRRACR